MNYTKLQLSFFVLFLMTVIHLFLGVFIIKNTLISILSIIAMALCIGGLFYTMHTKEKKK